MTDDDVDSENPGRAVTPDSDGSPDDFGCWGSNAQV